MSASSPFVELLIIAALVVDVVALAKLASWMLRQWRPRERRDSGPLWMLLPLVALVMAATALAAAP